MNGDIKFLLYSDLHYDIIPDGEKRLKEIVDAVHREKVDFAVFLGDMLHDLENGKTVQKLLDNMGIPHFMVVGNHDLDTVDKMEYLDFYHLNRTYYSVDKGTFHLIFLDTNYLIQDGIYYDYSHGNYYSHNRENLSPEQISWLIEDIDSTCKPCLIFSHAMLFQGNDMGKGEAGIGGFESLHQAFVEINRREGWNKICACVNGHNHTNSYRIWDEIHYLDVPSASNMYIGPDSWERIVLQEGYDPQMWLPYLNEVMPFEDTLYGIVTLCAGTHEMTIQGVSSRFIGGDPQERGHEGVMCGIPIVPNFDSRKLILY